MRTDPRLICVNSKENILWAVVHDCVAHPLMGLTCYSKFSIWFHNLTSRLAWPR